MAEVYIRPEDVSPADALKVLAFLNSAQTPEQIAEAVEFPDERDVGVRVALRLLNRRRELGAFTSLHQVADVPQVGPERFTEIVIALSAPAIPPEQAGDAGLHQRLVEELRALRETVETLQSMLGANHRATLRAVRDQPFLGQPVTIVATVTDARGTTPRVGTPVTFTATWGRLRVAGDLAVQQGATVTARTGADGTVGVTLLPPTSEDLLEPQQSALETTLRSLDESALTPRDTQAGLEEMVRHYAWEANVDLRRAVDIYFRDFRHRLLDTVNLYDYMRAWSYFDATVTMLVRGGGAGGDDAPDTQVQAAAALTLRIKDWLGPWLETYLALSESESDLEEDLQGVKERGGEAGALVQGVYGRVRDFIRGQRGLVGEYAGRKVAGTSLGRFLDSELGDLPLDTRLVLFPALKVAADTVDTSGVSVLTAVGQVRSDLRQELGERIGTIQTGGIDILATRLDELQSQLGGKVDITAFDSALARKVDATAFTDRLGSLQTVVSRLEDEIFRERPAPEG